ncbi:MAG: disulfide bond formation protein B [Gammaproteobacteria bacterium]
MIRRLGNFIGFAICVLMIGFAYYLQYARGMNPCALCIFERITTAGLGLVFLLAWLHHPKHFGRWIYIALLLVVSAIGVFVSARHVYIQHLPPDEVGSCGASLKVLVQHLPPWQVIREVLHGSGECAHVDTLFGVSLPLWVLGLTAALGIGGIAINSRR